MKTSFSRSARPPQKASQEPVRSSSSTRQTTSDEDADTTPSRNLSLWELAGKDDDLFQMLNKFFNRDGKPNVRGKTRCLVLKAWLLYANTQLIEILQFYVGGFLGGGAIAHVEGEGRSRVGVAVRFGTALAVFKAALVWRHVVQSLSYIVQRLNKEPEDSEEEKKVAYILKWTLAEGGMGISGLAMSLLGKTVAYKQLPEQCRPYATSQVNVVAVLAAVGVLSVGAGYFAGTASKDDTSSPGPSPVLREARKARNASPEEERPA